MAVAFVYLPAGTRPGAMTARDVERLNDVNRRVHDRLLAEGTWHLHQFTLPDDTGVLRRDADIRALRFLAGNPRTGPDHVREVLAAVVRLGDAQEGGPE